MFFFIGVAGSAAYTVFATDYDNYAGIFTCQKIAFSHRQSVSILSRHKTLDKMYLDKVSEYFFSYVPPSKRVPKVIKSDSIGPKKAIDSKYLPLKEFINNI